MDEITAIANAHKIVVIEDTAQAHLARYHGRFCGTLGTAASFSFYPTKNLGACGESGAVTTNDDDIAQSVRELRDWGAKHQRRGFNNRMHALQAAILSLKLKHLQQWTTLRQAAAARYEKQLAGHDGLQIPKRREETEHVFHQFAVLVRQREKTIQKLKENNIGFGIHYPRPLHLQPCFAIGAVSAVIFRRRKNSPNKKFHCLFSPKLKRNKLRMCVQLCAPCGYKIQAINIVLIKNEYSNID